MVSEYHKLFRVFFFHRCHHLRSWSIHIDIVIRVTWESSEHGPTAAPLTPPQMMFFDFIFSIVTAFLKWDGYNRVPYILTSARDVWMSRVRVWHLNGKSNMICGQWVCVCGCTHEQPTNNWQSVELRVGFTASIAVASSILWQRNDGAQQLSSLNLGLVKVAPIEHPHEHCANGQTWWDDDLQRREGWGKWIICYDFYCRFDTATSSLSTYQQLRCVEVWR